jgi:hypothetical protein
MVNDRIQRLDDIVKVHLVCPWCSNPLSYDSSTRPVVQGWCQNPKCDKPNRKKILLPGSPEMRRITDTQELIRLVFALQNPADVSQGEIPFEIKLEFTEPRTPETSKRRGE